MTKNIIKTGNSRYWGLLLIAATAYGFFHSTPALAVEANDIAENIVDSTSRIPGLISGLSYILGMVLGVWGIFKLKDHVENSTQTPLRNPLTKLLAGGALFALPIIYEAMRAAIQPGNGAFSVSGSFANSIGALMGTISGLIPTLNINNVLANIISSINELPGLVTALAYLFGLVLGVYGILKLRDHVENPEQTPLREGIIRLLIGGALFALPTIYSAMYGSIVGGGLGFGGTISSILGALSNFYSSESQSVACSPISIPLVGALIGNSSLGNVFCNIVTNAGAIPAFLAAISYLFGIVLGVWALLKIRDHVLNPTQTSVWEGISRLIAGGAFFALPYVIEVMRASVTPDALNVVSTAVTNTGFNEPSSGGILGNLLNIFGVGGGCGRGGGLDVALSCFMADIFGPMHVLINFFGTISGTVLIMIGISRLMKSAQEGARGPGGFGTMMTFFTGGALISANAFLRAFSTTFFTSPITFTYASLQYTNGMTAAEVAHVHLVISAILKFVILIGLVSFVRGLFIVRSVSEGNNQASLMAGVTHILGGALAVNLGPLLNAVQATLGLSGFGVTFS